MMPPIRIRALSSGSSEMYQPACPHLIFKEVPISSGQGPRNLAFICPFVHTSATSKKANGQRNLFGSLRLAVYATSAQPQHTNASTTANSASSVTPSSLECIQENCCNSHYSWQRTTWNDSPQRTLQTWRSSSLPFQYQRIFWLI